MSGLLPPPSPLPPLRTQQDARLIDALAHARSLGWVASERGLAEELGLALTVFYKVRNGLQSFPREGLFALETQLGLSSAYIREGRLPIFSLPLRPGGERLSIYERIRIAALSEDRPADDIRRAMDLSPARWKLLRVGSESQLAGLPQALARAFPHLATPWLMLGIGLPAPVPPPVEAPPAPAPGSQPQIVHLPYIESRARAGFVSAYLQGARIDHLPLRPHISRPDQRTPADAVLIEVEGDSMVPTLLPQDLLLVAPLPPAEWRYAAGGLYVVLFGTDHLVVKRLRRNLLATEGRLTLVSDNPAGGELELTAADLRGLFRVLSITRNL